MNTIYKYRISITDYFYLKLPEGATILTANFQDNGLYIWAMVISSKEPTQERIIRVFGTGFPIEDASNLEYINTVYRDGFVWHIFEEY